ncbi:MAG: 50S ribosomal protein L23, partial [Candidatus Heimdallarchaeota archaeon]|nr:50S ribosomal protein L23 [Candidatus Heimdallarchaeota archaeon]
VFRDLVITEKSTQISDNEHADKIIFYVHPWVTKGLLKSIFLKRFNIAIISINTLNIKKYMKKFRGIVGYTSNKKKAIITLAKSDNFDIASI